MPDTKDVTDQDLCKTITTLEAILSDYRTRIPQVYWTAFKAAVLRYIGRAKALQQVREGFLRV